MKLTAPERPNANQPTGDAGTTMERKEVTRAIPKGAKTSHTRNLPERSKTGNTVSDSAGVRNNSAS